jgi:hypothetical protein
MGMDGMKGWVESLWCKILVAVRMEVCPLNGKDQPEC